MEFVSDDGSEVVFDCGLRDRRVGTLLKVDDAESLEVWSDTAIVKVTEECQLGI